jgi:Ca2+/Na+ antiporter
MRDPKEWASTKKVLYGLLLCASVMFYLGALNLLDEGLFVGAVVVAVLASLPVAIVIAMLNIPRRALPIWLTLAFAAVITVFGGVLLWKGVEAEESEVCIESQSLQNRETPSSQTIGSDKPSHMKNSEAYLLCRNRQLFLGFVSIFMLGCGCYVLIRITVSKLSRKER